MLTESIVGDIKHHMQYGNVVVKLILVNVALFIVTALLGIFDFFSQSNVTMSFVAEWFYAHSSFTVSLYRPWTVFTHQFLHIGLLHVLFNMLWLYWFGEVFVLYMKEKRVLPLYLLGGVGGWLLFAVSYNVIPVLQPFAASAVLAGASASIMAIVFASVALNPHHKFNLMFIGEVSIVYVALGSLVLDMLAIPRGGAGTWFAHLGGTVVGYAYIKLLRSGYDIFSPADYLTSLFKKERLQVSHRNVSKPVHETSVTSEEQKRVDDILDKISRSGYNSLTKEEKDFLFRYSNK